MSIISLLHDLPGGLQVVVHGSFGNEQSGDGQILIELKTVRDLEGESR
jgi:hypothetical protein